MPSLQIRDLPPELHQRLAAVAASEHRSMAQQAIVLLERALQPAPSHRERRAAVIEELRKRTWPADLPDAVEMIREDRER